jgi:hypothetical protein
MFAAVRQGMGIRDTVPVEGVAEGMFGIDSKTKGAIQNVVAKLSDIPGMWDHKTMMSTPKATMVNTPSVSQNGNASEAEKIRAMGDRLAKIWED